MKKFCFFPIFFLYLFPLGAQPIDITVGGGIDNFAVDTKALDLSYNLKSEEFAFHPFWYARVNGEFGKDFLFDVKYQQDPLWQSSFTGSFGVAYGVVNAGLGMQLGMHDYASDDFSFSKTHLWDAGLLGYFKLQLPGYFFIGTDFVADFWGEMSEEGRSSRPFWSVYIGCWLPHIHLTLSYFQKEYLETKADDLRVRAASKEIRGDIEIFSKSSPFRISFAGAWLTKTISFTEAAAATQEQTADYLYAEFGFSIALGRYARWFIKGGIPLEVFNPKPQKFVANTGMVFTAFGNK
ncbi:MAG: hypothetical protein LBT01_02870 [Spirochaetaceae bacterium]|jgi:hypothetical protein|nr:hypothetical protein [Spirochaetaceae bacterium]